MPDPKVTLILAGEDELSKIFGNVGKTAAKEGKKIEKSFGDKLKNVGQTAGKLGRTLSLGVTAPLTLFAGAAVSTAVKAERLTKTLTGLAGGAQEAARYIDAIKTASHDTISQVDALAIANRSLSFGIIKNADEMRDLTEIAIALGRAQGLDAARAVGDLSTALSRNSPLILDNLGITLKLTEAYGIYADKIGKSVEALTAEEKSIAFREAALIKGKEAVERMGGVQDDAASSAERMKAQISDLSLTVGQMLIPIMSQGLDILGPLVQKFNDMDPATQKLVVGLGAIAAAAGPALSAMGKFTTLLAEHATGVGVMAIAVTTVALAVKSYQDAVREAKEETDEFFEDMLKDLNLAVDARSGIHVLAEAVNLFGGGSKRTKNAFNSGLLGIIADYGRAEVNAKQAAAAIKEVEKYILAQSNSVEESQALWDLWNSLVGESALKHRAWGDAVFNSLKYPQAAASEIERFKLSMGLADLEAGRFRETIEFSNEELERMNNEMSSADRAMMMRAQNTRLMTDEERKELAVNRQRIAATKEEKESAAAAAAAFQEHQEAAKAASRERAEAARQAQQEYHTLISSMKEATIEEFKQAILAQVPADLFIPVGKELGLLDQEQINKADAVATIVKEIADEHLPMENVAAAIKAMFAATSDPNFDPARTLLPFKEFVEFAEPSREAMEEFNTEIDTFNSIAPEAETGADNVSQAYMDLKGAAEEGALKVGDLHEKLLATAGRYDVDIYIHQHGRVDLPEDYHTGGVVPGPIGAPQLAIVHGGERIIPADSRSYSYQVNATDSLSTAMLISEMRRQRRYDELSDRM